jgi:pyruvate/2-oxoacid:ferredoxin oxidoreductase alpha subunit
VKNPHTSLSQVKKRKREQKKQGTRPKKRIETEWGTELTITRGKKNYDRSQEKETKKRKVGMEEKAKHDEMIRRIQKWAESGWKGSREWIQARKAT